MSFFGGRRQPEPTPPPRAEERRAPSQPSITPQQPVGFDTLIGANCTIEGVIRSDANVRLDGTFTGTLEITGNVLVGETAKINADIHARNVSIAGAVRGNVSGKKIQLLRTGRVWGDISAAALTTEEGAFIDGKITMVSHEAANRPLIDLAPAIPLGVSANIVEPDDEPVLEAIEMGEPSFLTDGDAAISGAMETALHPAVSSVEPTLDELENVINTNTEADNISSDEAAPPADDDNPQPE
ncbi:MAG: polymer-forming cytoskeletal protein [Burkholderiales bacterium]|nr:polymer-forming cytoskeletal protein [Anaerolineae bacterium]